MSSPPPPSWLPLGKHLLRVRYVPPGWSTNIFLTALRPTLLRHKGLWADIFGAHRTLDPPSLISFNSSIPHHQAPLRLDDDPASSDDVLSLPIDLSISSIQITGVLAPTYSISLGSASAHAVRFPVLTPWVWSPSLPPPAPPPQPPP